MSDTGARSRLRPDGPGVNAYRLLTALVVPRPIAWVSTVDAEGRGNLAPHSFFTVASGRPPVVLFSSLGRKDTVRTSRRPASSWSASPRRRCSRWSMPAVRRSSTVTTRPRARHPDGGLLDRHAASGGRLAGLDRVPARADRRGRVGVRRLRCRVTAITVRDDVLVDGHPAMEHLRPVSRLGGDEWGRPPEVFHLTRPTKPDDVL